MPGHDDATKRLLEEGARSYLQAISALISYEHEVQERCREVMEKNLDDYSSALKFQPPLKSDEIHNGVWPKPSQWDGSWRMLGVEIARRDTPPGIRWWGTYCCVAWQLEDPTFYCWVGEWYPTRFAAQLFQKFHQLNPRLSLDSANDVGVRESLEVEEASTFDEKLEGLFEQWIKLWKKVGGIKGAFKV
jgi:hypothetical protein